MIIWLSAPSGAAAVGVGVVVLAFLLLRRVFAPPDVAHRPCCSGLHLPSPASGVDEGGAGFRWARDQPLADQHWAAAAASNLVSTSPRSVLDGAAVPVPDGQPLASHATERGQKRAQKGGVARPCANPGCFEQALFRCAWCRCRAYCSRIANGEL